MTEQRIFEILLQNNKNPIYNFDYPKLQEKTVKCVAKKFTEIIYETLKQKSSASTNKRGNLLKFINSLCEVKECHLNEDSYRFYLRVVRNSFKTEVDENVNKLFCEINSDLKQQLPNTFTDEVIGFYKKKHSIQKEKIKKLEFIKMTDQENLHTKYDIQVRKNFSYYETNEDLIRQLLPGIPGRDVGNQSLLQQIESSDYRERQIKLSYALVNLKNEDTSLVQRVLQRLLGYANLMECEINFIQYLWVEEDLNVIPKDLLVEKFPFILERIILKYSTELLLIEDQNNVHQYFMNLEDDSNFLKIRKVCQRNPVIYYKLRHLLNRLYFYSYCNINVLKLADFIT